MVTPFHCSHTLAIASFIPSLHVYSFMCFCICCMHCLFLYLLHVPEIVQCWNCLMLFGQEWSGVALGAFCQGCLLSRNELIVPYRIAAYVTVHAQSHVCHGTRQSSLPRQYTDDFMEIHTWIRLWCQNERCALPPGIAFDTLWGCKNTSSCQCFWEPEFQQKVALEQHRAACWTFYPASLSALLSLKAIFWVPPEYQESGYR